MYFVWFWKHLWYLLFKCTAHINPPEVQTHLHVSLFWYFCYFLLEMCVGWDLSHKPANQYDHIIHVLEQSSLPQQRSSTPSYKTCRVRSCRTWLVTPAAQNRDVNITIGRKHRIQHIVGLGLHFSVNFQSLVLWKVVSIVCAVGRPDWFYPRGQWCQPTETSPGDVLFLSTPWKLSTSSLVLQPF